MLTRLDLRDSRGPAAELLPRRVPASQGPLEAVRSIIESVRRDGDAALVELTERFDGVRLDSLAVPRSEIEQAAARVDASVREALSAAVENVTEYHRHQRLRDVLHERGGVTVRERHLAVRRAGCYVPGGRAAYPSTLIMTAVPARVAGVEQIAVCVPPGPDGRIADVTLAAAAAAGVTEVHPVGGAQAVAALAFGTESIRAVDVIAGPGNAYVALAQSEVAGVVGVPAAFAGPSEVVVVADATSDAGFAAADLILQAEHGPDGLAWLVTCDADTAAAVETAVEQQTARSQRRGEIEATLAHSGYSVICADDAQAAEVVNEIAPEHLQLMVADPEAFLSGVRNAGAVFCGPWSTAALGDYAAGPNHVLPTDRSARFAGALSVRDFLKSMHVVTVQPHGLQRLAPHVTALAEAEGLVAHAESVRLRLEALGAAPAQPDAPTRPATRSTPGAAPRRAVVQPREDIALMEGYHSPQLDVSVRLNTNESPLPPPPEFSDAVAAAASAVAWNRYPQRRASELRSRIAARHGVSADQVFAANGSNEVLQCLLLAYGGPGRRAVVFEPSYALHSHIARVVGTTVVEGRRDDEFAVAVDAATALIASTRPSVTFLCSPNNPSGTVSPLAAVRSLLDAAVEASGLLCVDEAYAEFAPESALSLIADDVPLAVTRTYSKTWAMAGARLGYLIGPAWLVAELDKVTLPYHLDSLKQALGAAALDFVDEMQARVATITAERARLSERLSELPVRVWPSGANFVLMRPRRRRGETVWRMLAERSILIRDCSSWPGLQDCLRVTVGTADENDRLISALEEILAS
ncbi:MAG: histidinol dehydrogenase [Acidimicrobiaceae bacterium]|nr:histidinol dehydrogenase [Acidimicrobiaceae bacterium]MCY4294627.1 histidinol dehydrogenase [Acidimicrobiaceae bacterium]